jgi:hypothetical protein
MKNYFEKNKEENFESMDSTFHSHRESRFKNSTILAIVLAKSKIYEVELKNLKFEEVKDFKKSKIEEFEV